MVAALTQLAAIGVPISATKMEGQDALLSIVLMSAGGPVAIDGAKNAGIFASQFFSTSDETIHNAVTASKKLCAKPGKPKQRS